MASCACVLYSVSHSNSLRSTWSRRSHSWQELTREAWAGSPAGNRKASRSTPEQNALGNQERARDMGNRQAPRRRGAYALLAEVHWNVTTVTFNREQVEAQREPVSCLRCPNRHSTDRRIDRLIIGRASDAYCQQVVYQAPLETEAEVQLSVAVCECTWHRSAMGHESFGQEGDTAAAG